MLVRVKDDVAQRYGLFLGRGAEEVDEPGADDAVVNHVVAAAGVAERRRDQYLQDHLVLPMGFGQVGRDPALLTGPLRGAGREACQPGDPPGYLAATREFRREPNDVDQPEPLDKTEAACAAARLHMVKHTT